ncbi:MAG TPA: PspC domain-containing protein [Sporichthya sp.]|nr:PspC domain-containing protein [Sporichthya sp.]
MTTTTPAPPPPAIRRFRRSKTDRTFMGVCGGIAEALAMDPVIVRVLMVVLAFFGGAGIIVYGACWLLMPEDESEPSLAERVLSRPGRNPWPLLLGVGAVSLAVVLSAGWFIDSRGALLIAVVVVAAVLLTRRQAETPPFSPPPFGPPPSGPPAGTAPTAPFHSWDAPATSGPTAGPAAVPTWTSTSTLPPLPPLTTTAPEVERPRPFLGRLTFFGVLIALGIVAAVDLAGADVDASVYPAVVVAGAGLGLLISTRWGRARWLIPLGVVGVLALPPTLFLDSYDGDWVDQEHSAVAPADPAGIASEYHYRGGRVLLDLSAVDFSGADVHTTVRVGAGELIVTVPAGVDVVTAVDLGLGDAEVFGTEEGGYGVDLDRQDLGADGAGGGTLTLDVEQGFGHVEVRRAAA